MLLLPSIMCEERHAELKAASAQGDVFQMEMTLPNGKVNTGTTIITSFLDKNEREKWEIQVPHEEGSERLDYLPSGMFLKLNFEQKQIHLYPRNDDKSPSRSGPSTQHTQNRTPNTMQNEKKEDEDEVDEEVEVGEKMPVKRGRGRPPKRVQEDEKEVEVGEKMPIKRGRGRPPKRVQEEVEVGEKMPIKRGRPPKRVKEEVDVEVEVGEKMAIKRGRGRPPKKMAQEPQLIEVVRDLKMCADKLEKMSGASTPFASKQDKANKKMKQDIEFLMKEVADIKETLRKQQPEKSTLDKSESDTTSAASPAASPAAGGSEPSQQLLLSSKTRPVTKKLAFADFCK
jgi:hypothetical protein